MSLIEFDTHVLGAVEDASTREWLETNGIGGSASSTIVGLNTRRYHGLLVAATKPPVGRIVMLSKLEETLVVDGARYELGVNQYPGAIHPQGYAHLKSFRLAPYPVFTYLAGGVELEKRIFMVQGENTVVIRYAVRKHPSGECALEVRPLVAFRDYHGTTHANSSVDGRVTTEHDLATVSPYRDLPPLHFCHNARDLEPAGNWYYNFEYERERERGLDFQEDLFNPFALRFDLNRTAAPTIIASTQLHNVSEADALESREVARRNTLVAAIPAEHQFERQLVSAADQFIVARGDQKSVIAGYPWFGDWGRDTMISLPGLTLVTHRFAEARNILLAFARCIDSGMLPNRFPDAGDQPEYNTVDATLWMFHAVHELLRYTRDYEFVRENLYEPLADIIVWHERGTRYGIGMTSDGLLRAGEPGVQLTWMDARVGDWVVTPRHGKPVEIEALWYNALRVMEHLAKSFHDSARAAHYADIAARAAASFPGLFWNEADGCLYDVVGDHGGDRAIRPNQIIAVSLPHSMLDADKAARVVEVVEWELLTPYGLRTLAPRDPNYVRRFGGDPRTRDSAYHQGTVWPWLLGPFLTAYTKVHGDTPEVRDRVDRFLQPLREHLWQAGLGQISEVFDADAPHRPGGCIAQAWSVAEVLRTYVEDAQGRRPAAPAITQAESA
jgi:predicted glycogen debranching enzyme